MQVWEGHLSHHFSESAAIVPHRPIFDVGSNWFLRPDLRGHRVGQLWNSLRATLEPPGQKRHANLTSISGVSNEICFLLTRQARGTRRPFTEWFLSCPRAHAFKCGVEWVTGHWARPDTLTRAAGAFRCNAAMGFVRAWEPQKSGGRISKYFSLVIVVYQFVNLPVVRRADGI